MLTRRQLIASAAAALPAWCASRPPGVVVESHIHLFAGDPRFPYALNAPYAPQALPLEQYLKFVAAARIDHAVIVHPEPYQDDHRYLEHCLANEPTPGFFKGTCLFDPIAPETPARMQALVDRHPGRIVALRIHEMHEPGTPPAVTGPIKDRDMRDPAMRAVWQKAQALGLAIQMHFLPYYAPQIGELASRFPEVPVILDHLGRGGQGSPAEFAGVLKLASFPRVYMKYSGVEYSSKERYPYADVQPLVRRAFDAFGPNRLVWGAFGSSMDQFDRQVRLLDEMFDFASEADRTAIRGANAMKLFHF
jgi:predicted TIM-barrel fold metal-dependent hydrolase